MLKIFKKYLLYIWRDSAEQINEILSSLVENKVKARILEVGSHDGSRIIERVKNIEEPDIYAIEIDEEYIKLSREKGIKTYKANAESRLPFKSNFFDLVSANQIVEHLLNTDNFIEEIHRVLKPKGYLLIASENLSSWHNIFALILGWQAFSQHMSRVKNIGNPLRISKYTHFKIEGMHHKIFTPRGLADLAKLHGLKIEKSFGAGYYPLPPPFSRIFSYFDPVHSAFIGLKALKPFKKYHES